MGSTRIVRYFRPFILALLAFGLCSLSWAAPKSNKNSIPKFRSQLAKQQAVVNDLKQRLTELELQLGRDNRDLLQLLKSGEELEREVAFISEKIVRIQREITVNQQAVGEEYQRLLVHLVDGNQDPSTLVLIKAITRELKYKALQLTSMEGDGEVLQTQVKLLTRTLQGNMEQRQGIFYRLEGLEQEKNRIAQNYLSATKRRSEIKDGLAELKQRQKRKRQRRRKKTVSTKVAAVTTILNHPLKKFISKKHKVKGITYRFAGMRPVVATGKGEIVYLGELSTYGNLLIINHGKKTRSILLGEFVPKVKKGQKVAGGELIGYTSRLASTVGQEGQLYFEVRQGEVIQNTALLLDRQDKSKNNLSKKNNLKQNSKGKS